MKSKGFTIIEILTVIIIIAVISIVAVLAISRYTENAHKDVFINDAKIFINAARTKYNSDKIAQEPKNNEALVIPVSSLEEIDASNGYASPYGHFDLERCYVIIIRENEQNIYYIATVDDSYTGLNVVKEDALDKDSIVTDEDGLENVRSLSSLKNIGVTIRIGGSTYGYLDDGVRNNPSFSTFLLKKQ